MKKGVNDNHRYDDIIHLPHPVSSVHPPMPLIDRAAQFAPFAALTGYEDAVKEEARQTEEKRTLDENAKKVLDNKLQLICARLAGHPEVSITYFVSDERKEGGAYKTVSGRVKKMDLHERQIMLDDGTGIEIDQITEICGNIFSNMEVEE